MPVNDSNIVECRTGSENTLGAAFARGWYFLLQNGCAIRKDSGASDREPIDQQLARCSTVRNSVLASAGRVWTVSTSRFTRWRGGDHAAAAIRIVCKPLRSAKFCFFLFYSQILHFFYIYVFLQFLYEKDSLDLNPRQSAS
jgi:hypothetical protein